jgi:LacI family transcriptional regulator
MAGIKDVARLAGVSIATVSNAIHGAKFVSDELKARVARAVAELGYQVNPIASGLKGDSTRMLGIIITNFHRVFFPGVIKGIQEVCLKKGYHYILFDSDDRFETEKQFVESLAHFWVDGIILDSVADNRDAGYFRQIAGLRNSRKVIPVVSLERRLQEHGIDSVIVNNYHGGQQVTRHLLQCGCRKIAFVSGPMNSCMVQDRLRGYVEEMEKAGIRILRNWIVEGDFSIHGGYQSATDLLRRKVEVDAIFSANDQMAVGIYKALAEAGRKVGGDVRVAGFDNTYLSMVLDPPLTTIAVPMRTIGERAAEMMFRRLRSPNRRVETVELPARLVVRASTQPRAKGGQDDLAEVFSDI